MVEPVRECVAELDDAAWSAYSAVVERFETAWYAQGDAGIVDFLPAAEDPSRRRVLVALIKIDQEHRWRAGQRPLVETYLDQWPELSGSDQTVAELLAAECLTRAAFDQPVQRPELEQRFPGIAGRIDLGEIEEQAHRETLATGRDPDGTGDEWSDTLDGLTEPVSRDVFLARLTAAGLMTAEALEQCLTGLSEPERSANGRELAQRLVQLGKLTAYQAQTLSQGRDDPLVLGNYVILEPLGHGGMGLVFKAVHRRMDRIVALKILASELIGTPEALRRFQREVKAAARLAHPNIVIAHDADEADGRPFLVMEYVDGLDLAALVRQQGPLPAAQALDYILQAACGLQYAHEHGVIHRDIKPANLVVAISGQPSAVSGQRSGGDRDRFPADRCPLTATIKILDMGLAHLDSADAAQDELTGAGQVMGTVDFMAPEQAIDAHAADGRADIYSLGATLWYLLTGQSMFAGRTTAEKLLAHQNAPIPSLASICLGMPVPLEAVFRRMVANRPEDRNQTMADLIADLEPLRDSVVDLPAAAIATGKAGSLTERDMPEILAAPQVARTSEMPCRPAAVGTASAQTAATRSARVSDLAETADRRSPRSSPDAGPPNLATGNRPPSRRGWRQLAVAGAGGLLLIWLGIWVVVRDKEGNEAARIRLPEGGIVTHEPETVSPRPGTPARGAGGEGGWNLPPGSPPPAVAPFDAARAKSHQEAWANYLGVPVEIENSLGMRFVLIPPGEFDMGSTEAEVARLLEQAKGTNQANWYTERLPHEVPQHRVRITKAFYLGTAEVTQAEYQRVTGTNPSEFKDDPTRPVENVTWDMASAFCRKLSTPLEEQASRTQYRLPTEAEWEYACRAGTTTAFSWGDTARTASSFAWISYNSERKTRPVRQKAPNAWGLYDMHGNVWEWCQDRRGDTYYATSPLEDPRGAEEGWQRAARGGTWAYDSCVARSACRVTSEPASDGPNRGLRVARQVLPIDTR